ncbi:MAG TPA: zinc-binding dehydrogenase [bacterium]|nr:zinc-binding dehydrogenase [bacterium]
MKFKAAVIEQFNEGPVLTEFELEPLCEGEILVKIESAGICGSDFHIFSGRDPRIRLPMIPGHEGVGIVSDFKGVINDIKGERLKHGDRIIWDRGLVCGRCFYCAVEKKPYLCANRRVYGITMSVSDRPFPNGCYSQFIKLSRQTNTVKADSRIPPETLVPVGCSGATSYHAVEEADLKGGETVLIQGPGPLGIFTSLFCREKGAGEIIMSGSSKSRRRMELSKNFGVKHLMYRDTMKLEEQAEFINEITGGKGADVVFEMAGTSGAIETGQCFINRGGKYIIAGVAVPVGAVGIDIYENLVRKNATVKGIWVSDTSHLLKAFNVAEKYKTSLGKLISRRYSLEDARAAIESVNDKDVLKSVIMP